MSAYLFIERVVIGLTDKLSHRETAVPDAANGRDRAVGSSDGLGA